MYTPINSEYSRKDVGGSTLSPSYLPNMLWVGYESHRLMAQQTVCVGCSHLFPPNLQGAVNSRMYTCHVSQADICV